MTAEIKLEVLRTVEAASLPVNRKLDGLIEPIQLEKVAHRELRPPH